MDLLPLEGLTPASSVPAYRYIDPVRRVVSFEAMVRYRGSRYSVSPDFAGKPVEVVIRSCEVVIAEHREAAPPGQCIAVREHIAELWRITNEEVVRPPRPDGPRAATPEVQRVDLRIYEEVGP